MSIKQELNKLKEPDIWSLMLFVLYKVKDVPEFSGLSELAYIMDKKSFLKFCEYFGGCTITVPKIEEVEMLLYSLLLYNYVDVTGMSIEDGLELISNDNIDKNELKFNYGKLKQTLAEYEFTSRGKQP